MKNKLIVIVSISLAALIALLAIVFVAVPFFDEEGCTRQDDGTCVKTNDPDPSPTPGPTRSSTQVPTPSPTATPEGPVSYKPVLYLYPERDRRVSATLDMEGTLDTTYPAPGVQDATQRGTRATWTVTASPDGTLTDDSGRTYPSLFWEGPMPLECPEEGSIVAREDVVPFLEEKLTILGLNDQEAADFITFWAPRMRANEYTFVSFDASVYTPLATYSFADEAGAALEPDTFIRVFMTIRQADANTPVRPQTLAPAPERAGFTAVEWGGTVQ